MKMKILVTGSTGFIGKNTIKNLLKSGHEVIATAKEPEIKALSKKIKYLPYKLGEDVGNLFMYFHKPDALIHLAWDKLDDYNDLAHLENLEKHYSFIKNIVQNGLRNVTVIGTCLEYGLQNGCLEEEMATKPINPYGLAKDTLRKFIEELSKRYPFHFKWIRLFYLYGEGQSKKTILFQLDQALENNEQIFNMSGGEQLRDYLSIEKVAKYIIKIALQNKVNGTINCCSGKPISIKRLVEEHLKHKKKKIKLNLGYYPYPDYEPMAFWGDNTKLLKIINGNHD